MSSDKPDRINLAVESDAARRLDALRDLFPEAFKGESLDLEKIAAVLGVSTAEGTERYGLNWSGRADAESAIQMGSVGTLRADVAGSLNYDAARHLLIEGDNLEVLRLLQRGYNDKVKVVYIDPPYNTGKDFVYPDNYRQGLDAYLKTSGQKGQDGTLSSSNSETNGRLHSAWLTMMYPRLALARNLLTPDGVILVSIDENEVHNLRHLLDETFGPENFVAELVWEKTRKNDATFFSIGHEYMLVYARSRTSLKDAGPKLREERPGAREIIEKVERLKTEHRGDLEAVQDALRAWYRSLKKSHPSKALSRYKQVDERGAWRDRDISWPGGGGPRYDVIHPRTGKPCAVPADGWRFSDLETMRAQIDAGLVVFREDHTKPPFRKAYLIPAPEEEAVAAEEALEIDEEEGEAPVGLQVMPSVIYKQSQAASKHLKKVMGAKVFDNPKDHEVLARLINYVTRGDREALVLDFFAGSGATAEAVLQLNAGDGGNRRFIGVQLPEKTPEKSTARKQGFDTIFELCRERILRVAEELDQSLGLRVLRLGVSNFKVWDAETAPTDEQGLANQILAYADSLADGADDESLLVEIVLKSGIMLDEHIERVDFAGAPGALVSGRTICLAREVTDDVVEAVVATGGDDALFLASAFGGDDQLKANTHLALRDAQITMRTV